MKYQFSQFLKRHRGSTTLTRLSKLSGVTLSELSSLENERHLPSNTKHILAILEAMDLDRETFVQGIRSAAYDVNMFQVPCFRGTEPIAMEAICMWADRYYSDAAARSQVG